MNSDAGNRRRVGEDVMHMIRHTFGQTCISFSLSADNF